MTGKETTVESKNIYQRMNAIMLDVTYVQKGEKEVDGKYRYVSHDAVSKKIHEAVVTHGVHVRTDVVQSSIEQILVTSWDSYAKKQVEKTQYLARVVVDVTFINIDNPDDCTQSKGWVGMGVDAMDKAPGKAVSYACKYALLKSFLLETGEDPDHDQNQGEVVNTQINKASVQAIVEDTIETPEQKASKWVNAKMLAMSECASMVAYEAIVTAQSYVNYKAALEDRMPDLLAHLINAENVAMDRLADLINAENVAMDRLADTGDVIEDVILGG